MDDLKEFKKFEEGCKVIREENKILLSEFEQWLIHKGLSSKVINNYVSNVDFYIYEYLLNSDCIHAKDGTGEICIFLGYWFIKKALWSSESALREYAAGLKKFYQFMSEKGEISPEKLSALKTTIKEEMLEWLKTMELYRDPDIDDPAVI